MAQTREQHRPASAQRKRGRKRSELRGATGEFVIVKLGKSKKKVRIPVGPSGIAEKGPVGNLLKGYYAAVKKAKKAGRPLDYTFRVSPDGKAKQVAAPVTKTDALDAALAAARERGQVKVAEILKGEDMLTASDFGSLIGASHETVNVKRGRGEVLGLQGATRAVRYPRWQVTDASLPLPGLPKLFEILGRQPWTVYRFLRTAHAELGGRTALDAMKAGQQEAVLNVARNQMTGVFT
jgi:O-acetyl-ADP-ribose deacetylase (regulator of RNase III)